MDEIISYKMCAVKVRNAKLRNYLKETLRRREWPPTKPLNLVLPRTSRTKVNW